MVAKRIAPTDRATSGEWEELMARSLAGDEGAYRILLGHLGKWLRGYYAGRLPAPMVEDAAQDALIAIHDKRHTYEPGRPLRPWIAAIARYKWIDRLRTMKSEDELGDEDFAVGDHESAVTSAILLDGLLARLKTPQADAIRLVKLQGFSIAEASRITGQSESLVKVNIHRGLATLSREVEASD